MADTITAGIDLGSTYAKVVVMKNAEIVGYAISPTGSDHDETARRTMERACKIGNVDPKDIIYKISTGYGRRVVTFADENISEISANATGVEHIARTAGVRTVIDIGGQDTKVISLDDNMQMTNFSMNDKCAAGTGRFLEVLARVLEVPLDDMGDVSLRSQNPVDITSTCLVFAKSEVATMIFKGEKKEDIIAGIHRAVARRLVAMAKKVGVKDVVFFDGGPARNKGMIAALEKELGRKMMVPPMPQIVTATGAAILAREKYLKKQGS
jgi:predicted CoA-substrate-specific enzyme activase